MANELKLRRGTAAENDAFIGAEGELTVDTTNDALRLHDGTTAGGFEIARADLTNVDDAAFAAKALAAGVGGGGGGEGGTEFLGANASFLVATAEASLTNERVLQAGNGIKITDGGPGGGLQVRVDYSTNPPANLGAASAGSSFQVARADHVHAMPTATDVGAVPVARQVIAGTGLSGGGALSSNVTLNLNATLDLLTDVVVNDPQNGDILMYNEATSQFENTQSYTKLTTKQAGTVVGSNSGVTTLNFTGAGVQLTADTGDNTIVNVAIDKSLSTKEVQDIVGGMVSGNTESGIAVTYDPGTNKLNFDVADFTITLTGAISGSATITNLGSVTNFATTLADNSITLGQHTVGSYVEKITAGKGISVSGSDVEKANVTLAVDTGDANFVEDIQDLVASMTTGATKSGIDVVYNDAGIGTGKLNFALKPLKIELTGAMTGGVLVDYTAPLNANGQVPAAITTTLVDDAVQLGKHTTGNYVASVAVSGVGLTATPTTASEGAAVTITSNATNLGNPNTIVARDASGNFSAGTISANLTGAASANVLKAGDIMTGALAVSLGTQTTPQAGINVYRNGDTNAGVRIMSGNGDGGTLTAWNGGLGSSYGIGFHCLNDNTTRGVFDTRTGTFKATLFDGTATSARYADLAERYEADAVYEPGTVVVFGGSAEITACTQIADTASAGVISTNPALMMNSEAGSDDTHPYVALVGRVPCKVVGKVRKGQLLTTSDVPGHAKASTGYAPGSIIGKALENKDTDGPGVIEISVQRF